MAVAIDIVGAVKTAYDTLVTATAATVVARAAVAADLVTIEAITFLEVDVTNADYNTPANALQTAMATLVIDRATMVSAVNAERIAELATIAAIKNTGDSTFNGSNQWLKIVGAGAGILTYTNYIGFAPMSDSKQENLIVRVPAPAKAFPNF